MCKHRVLSPIHKECCRGAHTYAHTLLPQVVRQRDTLRQLLQSAGSDLDQARRAYAASLSEQPATPGGGTPGGAAAAEGTPAGGTQEGQSGPDYRALHADLEQALKEAREEAGRTHDMLAKDVSLWGCGWGGERAQSSVFSLCG